MDSFKTPPPAEPGSDVAVIAPSSGGAAQAPHVLDLALDRLDARFDVNPVVHPTARQSHEFLADHPRARAAAIHEAFKDPSIDAVFATIGGDDQLRILKYLDPETLRQNPTRFFGMSDNTNLALYLWNQGLISFYGGQLMNQVGTPGGLHPYNERYLRRALFENTFGEFDAGAEWADLSVGWDIPRSKYEATDLDYESAPGWSWRGGDGPVSGRLWGGCLAILEWHLMTGRYLPEPEELDGAILALETSEELPPASRLKWFLMSLGERGLLEGFDGVIVGRPATETWRESRSDDQREAFRRQQRETITEWVGRYNPEAPIVFDLDFGHTDPTAPIPIGSMAHLDPLDGITFTM